MSQAKGKEKARRDTVTTGRTKRSTAGKGGDPISSAAIQPAKNTDGNESEDSYDSGGEVERTADDDNFLDLEDEDDDMIREYNEKQVRAQAARVREKWGDPCISSAVSDAVETTLPVVPGSPSRRSARPPRRKRRGRGKMGRGVLRPSRTIPLTKRWSA